MDERPMPTNLTQVDSWHMSARFFAIATCAIALLVAPSAAQAGLLEDVLGDCANTPTEQPFTRWLDPMTYALAPNGGLESGATGWTLSGANVVSGNESFYVHSASDSHSLSIPAGASATTAATCISVDRPTARLFVRRTGGLLGVVGVLWVDEIYQDDAGVQVTLPLTPITATSSWAPTLQIPIVTNVLPQLDGGGVISLRFRSVGASFQVDDVYVDPYVKH